MRRGGQTACKVKPEYGYRHPDCRLQPPNPAVVAAAGGLLHFELHLLNWYPDREVFHYGEEGGVIKR